MLSLNGKCLDMMVQCWQGRLAQLWQARQLGVAASLDVSTNECMPQTCMFAYTARPNHLSKMCTLGVGILLDVFTNVGTNAACLSTERMRTIHPRSHCRGCNQTVHKIQDA